MAEIARQPCNIATHNKPGITSGVQRFLSALEAGSECGYMELKFLVC
jgi:hypothetical protein